MTKTAAAPLTVQIDMSDRCSLIVDGDHRAMLVIDWRARSVGTEIRRRSENGVTEYEWNGHQTAYALPDNTDPVALAALVTDVLTPLVLARCAAYDALEIGPREQVRLGYDEAGIEIAAILDQTASQLDHDVTLSEGGFWDASDYFASNSDADIGITAATTDEEIEVRAAELVAEARAESVVIDHDDTEGELRRRRDELV
ncbi:MAG: hypothetical protein ACYC1Z_14895 [Georgenia sp.]